jgi:hypothetical protein
MIWRFWSQSISWIAADDALFDEYGDELETLQARVMARMFPHERIFS